MEKWFGRTFETFGDTNHDFLIKTRGSVKVQSGKQFIEIIKDGKLNVDVDLLFEVSSPNEIKSLGIYYCEGDESLYVKIGLNLLKISDGTDSTYVSYIAKQEVTSELLLQAQNNIGLVFKTLAEALSIVIDGFVYIIDELTFYTVSKNNFSKLLFSIPDPYTKQFTVRREDDKPGGALNLIGEGKGNGISLPSSNIYELLGNLYINSPTGKIIINEGEKDILTVDINGVTSLVNIKTQGSIIANDMTSHSFSEGESGFRLYYNSETHKTILEVDLIIERDKSLLNSEIRTYSEGTTVSKVEVDMESTTFKVRVSPYIEIKAGDFIEILPYLLTVLGQIKVPVKVPMLFYVLSSSDGISNMKLYPDDSVISYDKSSGILTYQSELGEVTVLLAEGLEIGDIFTGASLYRVAQAGNPDDSSTWLETFCTDYLHNSISLQLNYTYNGEVHIKEHSIIGNIEEVLEEPHRPWKLGLYSDLSVLSGTVFRYPIDIADDEKGELINFPRYNSTLAAGLLDNYEEIKKDSLSANIIPTIGWIKKIINIILPVGSILMWNGSSPPERWLLCNGGSFSSTTYPKLYEVLSSTSVPDLRDKFIVGAGSEYAVKATGGLKEFLIMEDNLPRHRHSVSDYYRTTSSTSVKLGEGDKKSITTPSSTTANSRYTSYYGSTTPTKIDNRPPYYALTFIIKAIEA